MNEEEPTFAFIHPDIMSIRFTHRPVGYCTVMQQQLDTRKSSDLNIDNVYDRDDTVLFSLFKGYSHLC